MWSHMNKIFLRAHELGVSTPFYKQNWNTWHNAVRARYREESLLDYCWIWKTVDCWSLFMKKKISSEETPKSRWCVLTCVHCLWRKRRNFTGLEISAINTEMSRLCRTQNHNTSVHQYFHYVQSWNKDVQSGELNEVTEWGRWCLCTANNHRWNNIWPQANKDRYYLFTVPTEPI